MRKTKFVLVASSIMLLILAMVAFPLAVSAAPLPSAAVIAHSGQEITGNIVATGKDIGIYIGPGVYDVTVKNATVSGAGFEGILVQDTRNVVIEYSTISGNGVDASIPGPPAPTEFKAIVLAGTTDCKVLGNTVVNNIRGGISVLDDGPNQPFAYAGPANIANIPTPKATAGIRNTIMGNTIKDNLNDCGIVVSGKNVGGGVFDTIVSNNTVIGFNPAAGDFNPGVGGIVVATGYVAASTVDDTFILNNKVTGGFIAGISIHCGSVTGRPGLISNTTIIGNTLSNNGPQPTPPNKTPIGVGIEFLTAGPPPFAVITSTRVYSNTISDAFHITGVNNTTNTDIQPANQ